MNTQNQLKFSYLFKSFDDTLGNFIIAPGVPSLGTRLLVPKVGVPKDHTDFVCISDVNLASINC